MIVTRPLILRPDRQRLNASPFVPRLRSPEELSIACCFRNSGRRTLARSWEKFLWRASFFPLLFETFHSVLCIQNSCFRDSEFEILNFSVLLSAECSSRKCGPSVHFTVRPLTSVLRKTSYAKSLFSSVCLRNSGTFLCTQNSWFCDSKFKIQNFPPIELSLFYFLLSIPLGHVDLPFTLLPVP